MSCYLQASWVPISALRQADMLLTTDLGCQRRQKALPERLPEVSLSLVHLTSVHIAAVAPVNSAFALALLAKLWCNLGPADRPCWTTAGFWISLAGRQRKWHLATITGASSSITQAGRGSTGHHRDKQIHVIITCCLQTSSFGIFTARKTTDVLFKLHDCASATSCI